MHALVTSIATLVMAHAGRGGRVGWRPRPHIRVRKIFMLRLFQLLLVKLREEDKIKHMVWSFWLMLGALTLWSVPVAFAAVFLLGLAKECWDFRYGSGFCLYDITGNLIGSTAGLALAFVLAFALPDLSLL